MKRCAARVSASVFAAAAAVGLAFRNSSNLVRVAASTLGLWSSGDDYLVESRMLRSADYVDGGWRYERIEGASHWLQLDRPERVNELLLEFLR